MNSYESRDLILYNPKGSSSQLSQTQYSHSYQSILTSIIDIKLILGQLYSDYQLIMNYLFYLQLLTPEQASKFTANILVYNMQFLKQTTSSFEISTVKKNNKKTFKNFYQSFISKAMKNIDIYVWKENKTKDQKSNYIIWDQFAEVSKQSEYDLVPQSERQWITFNKDTVWAQIDDSLLHLLKTDNYLPPDADTVISIKEKIYEWGGLLLKVSHILKNQSHIGTFVVIYYQPCLLIQHKNVKQIPSKLIFIFRPVISMLFEVPKIVEKSELQSQMITFESYLSDMIFLFTKFQEERKGEPARLDTIETLLKMYYLKAILE